MTQSQITTIVFDVGNVLIDYNPSDVVDAILPNTPYKDELIQYFLCSTHWDDLDRGSRSLDDIHTDIQSYFPNHPSLLSDMNAIVSQFVHHTPIIQGSKAIFRSLKSRYPVYLLSNFQSVPFSRLRELYPFLYEVNGCVVSEHINLMKPEPEIYHYFLKKFNVEASECVFIDDREENIAACREIGMHGIVFKSPDQLATDLNTLGISPHS